MGSTCSWFIMRWVLLSDALLIFQLRRVLRSWIFIYIYIYNIYNIYIIYMCVYIYICIYMTQNLHRKKNLQSQGTLRVLIYILRVLIFVRKVFWFFTKRFAGINFRKSRFFFLIAYNQSLQYPYKIIITLRLFLLLLGKFWTLKISIKETIWIN